MERKIWYKNPAACWEEALPIGNGRLGAMIYGGTSIERLQMNEDSIWYGKPVDRHNPEARENLEEVRRLILGGRPDEAEELLRYAFSAVPQSERAYQPLANAELTMKGIREVSDYTRSLELGDAIVRVSFSTPKGRIRREYFASAKRNVIVVHLAAEGEETISLDALMTRERMADEIVIDREDRVFLTGNLGKGGLDYAVCCKAAVEAGDGKEPLLLGRGQSKGGSYVQRLINAEDCAMGRVGEHLVVRNAKTVTLYYAAISTYYSEDLFAALNQAVDEAAAMSYEDLKAEHIADHQKLFGQVELELPEEEELQQLSTAERLERIQSGEADPGMSALYFDYGRYLLISCSRPGSLPANLQGIWNHRMLPPWDSKYTININTEMNYWPAERCGLAECMEPVFELLLRMRKNGRKTAREMYGCRGFLAHHNTDMWADTAPQDIYIPATYWTQGGAWMSLFVWKHFEYHQDREWLERYFPILEDAVLFYLDFLVEDQGEYVTCPSVSPENTYIMENGLHARVCAGPAMDNQILRDLFRAYLGACQVLGKSRTGTPEGAVPDKNETGTSAEFAVRAAQILTKLPPTRIGKYGQIMEWREDYEEEEPGHRHISQLYALYPSDQINVDETPELAEAARKTLERRLQHGGGHTGWSAAWIVNFYAQLGLGEDAMQMLTHLFTNSTFPNLMDNHPYPGGPVFQIDGNLGGCDAITQMILQDKGRHIRVLPACPAEWKCGRLTGLRLKGKAVIDIAWDEEKVTARISADADWNKTVFCGGQSVQCELSAGESREISFLR